MLKWLGKRLILASALWRISYQLDRTQAHREKRVRIGDGGRRNGNTENRDERGWLLLPTLVGRITLAAPPLPPPLFVASIQREMRVGRGVVLCNARLILKVP